MRAHITNTLDARTREIDLESEITADTRKQAVFKEEVRAAAKRIRANTKELTQLRSSMNVNGVFVNGANVNGVLPAAPPKRRRRSRKVGQRKRDFVLNAISSLPPKHEFVLDDVFAALMRLHPGCGITRQHLSSLMWKLSTLPEGQRVFKQTVPWKGGNVQAKYVRLEEGVRKRTRPTQPVPEADVLEIIAARVRAEANGQ